MGDRSGTYRGSIDFLIVAFGKGTDTNIDTVRNQIIEVVEETLDSDITRNGNALDTQIVSANLMRENIPLWWCKNNCSCNV